MPWASCIDDECHVDIEQSHYDIEAVVSGVYWCHECGCENPVHYSMADLLNNFNERIIALEKKNGK